MRSLRTKEKKSYNDVFGKEIVTEGAVVKVDLVERLRGHADDGAVVVPAVVLATNHLLAQSHTPKSFGCLLGLSGGNKTRDRESEH